MRNTFIVKGRTLVATFLIVFILLNQHAIAQCTANGMNLPTHINIAIWPTQGYLNLFPNEATARATALAQVNAGLDKLNTLFIFRNTEFKVVFSPSNSTAPNQGNLDNLNYHIQIKNTFDDLWPCVKEDIIIVPNVSSAHGIALNKVARIGHGLLPAPHKVAHEIGHLIGLTHLENAFCGSYCNDAGTGYFMCSQSGSTMAFSSCDVNNLEEFTYTPLNCQNWMDIMDPLPNDFLCPVIIQPSITIGVDELFLIKNCEPDHSNPMYTVTVRGGEGGTTGMKVRAKFLKQSYDIDLTTMGMDFNVEDNSDPNYTILKIFENGVEKTFDLAELDEQTFHFQLSFSPDPGFTPNNLQVEVEGQLIHSLGQVTQKTKQKVYQTISGTISFLPNGDPVLVNGTLTLAPGGSNTFTINSPSILVSSGSSINLDANSTVVSSPVFHTTIEGCTNMWKGITIPTGASLNLSGVTVKDAQIGVTVNKGGKLIAKNCNFINNNIGVSTSTSGSGVYDITLLSNTFMTDDTGLRATYNGQSPVPGTIGFSGLILDGVSSGSSISINPEVQDPNQFTNLQFGILAFNSVLSVKKSIFQNMQYATKSPNYPGPTFTGTGIYATNSRVTVSGVGASSGNPSVSFSGCYKGIDVSGSSLSATGCFMDVEHTGISATGGTLNGFKITENNISAGQQGIVLVSQSGLPYASTVDNNTVTIPEKASSTAVGITTLLNENLSLNETAVFDNHVFLENGATGISLLGSSRTRLTSNDVHLLNASANYNGVEVLAGDKNVVNCNNIQGSAQRGIFGMMASRTDFLCNEADGPNYGLYFDGVFTGGAPKIFVGDNKMKNNTAAGLLLGSNALIGQQEHNGNRWSNAAGSTTAIHQGGPTLVDQSEFIVDGNENVEYLPLFYDPSDWFQDVSDPATSYVCQTETACPVPSLAYQGNLDRLIAKGEISGFANQDFSLWLAQKRLYERLSGEDNPYGSDTLFVSFLSTKQNTSVGKFADVQLGIRNLFEIPAGTLSAIDSLEAAMADNLEQLASTEQQLAAFGLSSQDSADLAIKRADMRAQIAQQDSTLSAHLAAIHNSRTSAAQSLLSQNASLSASDTWEVNEKAVNAIYLQTVAQGLTVLSTQQQSDLETIAAMCPLADGEAVLRARGMLALASGEYGSYDDVAGCSNSQERQQTTPPASSQNEVRVYPNPANSELRVQYTLTEESANFALYNAMGQLIEQRRLSGTWGTVVLPSGHLTDGIYYYFVGKDVAGKVSIQH